MDTSAGVEITGPLRDRYDEILTPQALDFLAELHRAFDARRRELLSRRKEREAELAAGALLDFLDETKDVREGDWRVAQPAPRVVDPRGEITRATDAKMTINAPNSRGNGWVGDHPDANQPLEG